MGTLVPDTEQRKHTIKQVSGDDDPLTSVGAELLGAVCGPDHDLRHRDRIVTCFRDRV
jgi:hypothetical protein